MAKGGGGSWKVAYADFVTAMMAFFLVMWIGSQDQKTRQSVANYFIDPSGVDKRPAKAGAVLQTPNYGSVPEEEKSAMAKGRESASRADGEHGPATKLVSDWLHHDRQRWQRWRDLARQAAAAAHTSPEVVKQHQTVEAVAAREVARQLQQELKAGLAGKSDGVYQDLLFWTMGEVNWAQLAEDLLAK